jgi:BASS family bile acid:Na+ symporter
MFTTVVILLGIPLMLGLAVKAKFPETTQKILKPVRWASIFLFAGFVIGALSANFSSFIEYIELIFLIVLLHNAFAFFSGYGIATLTRLPNKDRKTVSIETGIQNSGLALALIFNPRIFPAELELGGMAFIAAWWGIWHIIAGMWLAFFWRRTDQRKTAANG